MAPSRISGLAGYPRGRPGSPLGPTSNQARLVVPGAEGFGGACAAALRLPGRAARAGSLKVSAPLPANPAASQREGDDELPVAARVRRAAAHALPRPLSFGAERPAQLAEGAATSLVAPAAVAPHVEAALDVPRLPKAHAVVSHPLVAWPEVRQRVWRNSRAHPEAVRLARAAAVAARAVRLALADPRPLPRAATPRLEVAPHVDGVPARVVFATGLLYGVTAPEGLDPRVSGLIFSRRNQRSALADLAASGRRGAAGDAAQAALAGGPAGPLAPRLRRALQAGADAACLAFRRARRSALARVALAATPPAVHSL